MPQATVYVIQFDSIQVSLPSLSEVNKFFEMHSKMLPPFILHNMIIIEKVVSTDSQQYMNSIRNSEINNSLCLQA